MKVIVTADIEVHTKCDVSSFEIRKVFTEEDSIGTILGWIDRKTDSEIGFISESLGICDVKDNTLVGVYAIKKNIVLKPIEE